MSTEARRAVSKSTSTIDSITDNIHLRFKGAENPYSVWTCSLTRQERNLGSGIIVQLDSEDEKLQSVFPCLGAKLSQQKVDLQTHYALLTCHSNLEVMPDDDHESAMYFNLKGLQACVGPARDAVIDLEKCVSCAVSCCGPTSMLKLSSSAPAAYTLLPHTSGPCPIGYDFVVLFLNKNFEPCEVTLPPVVNVSQCLDLANLQTCLACQSGAQPWNCVAIGEFYLCCRQENGLNMVPVKVPYSKEQGEVKRFRDEIDWYQQHQRLPYNCSRDLQSFNGAPIICRHGGRRNLVGISSTGEQMVTLYGIFQLLAGGPVPLFAAMRHPSPRTLSPFRWSHHILPHLATSTMTNKGYLLEIFQLLVKKEGADSEALVNLVIADPMDVSVESMSILSEILKNFSGPEELKAVIRESQFFEAPNMSEDDFKGCILQVCKTLKGFMHHFLSTQRGTNPEKIFESVFHCTETMLFWKLQYPDVVNEYLLSNENLKSAAKAKDTYGDSQSIKKSFEHIHQFRETLITGMELEVQDLAQKIATLKKEEEQLELNNKQRSQDHMEWANVQSEEEKDRTMRSTDRSTTPAAKRAKVQLNQELGSLKQQTAAEGDPRPEIFSASPSIKMLKVLKEPGGQKIEIVDSVAGIWKEIGVLLDFDTTGQYLNSIENGSDNSPSSCCMTMFQHWLNGNGVEQTWSKLIDILKDCKHGTLADKVEKVLMAQDPPK